MPWAWGYGVILVKRYLVNISPTSHMLYFPGTYCPAGSGAPTPCSAGKACTTAGLAEPDLDCLAGLLLHSPTLIKYIAPYMGILLLYTSLYGHIIVIYLLIWAYYC